MLQLLTSTQYTIAILRQFILRLGGIEGLIFDIRVWFDGHCMISGLCLSMIASRKNLLAIAKHDQEHTSAGSVF